MATSGASYKFKHFQSSRDPDFASALLVYVRNTSAAIRTDTNEIAYWLDRFTEQFGHPFYVFGFYRDDELIGFAEGAYFADERLVVLDYLVIDEANRQNNVFFEFVDQLKRFLEAAHLEYRYAVVEACYGPGLEYPSPETCLLTRLLKLQGFRVIRAPYYQPRLLLDDAESGMQGDLLIYSTTNLDRIHTETYLTIVRCIYYKYYLPWQSITKDPQEAYKKHLDSLYTKIQTELGKKREILVNGHKKILAPPARRPVMTLHKVTSFAIQALIVVILLTAAMLGLKFTFHLSNGSFAAIYGLAVASFIALAGIVSKNARAVFAELASLAKHVLRKGGTTIPLPSGDETDLPTAMRKTGRRKTGSNPGDKS
jgi:hypothetical protein